MNLLNGCVQVVGGLGHVGFGNDKGGGQSGGGEKLDSIQVVGFGANSRVYQENGSLTGGPLMQVQVDVFPPFTEGTGTIAWHVDEVKSMSGKSLFLRGTRAEELRG